MQSTTLSGSKLSFLMACASPGSALAYHLGLVSNQAGLLRRTSGGSKQARSTTIGPVRLAAAWLTSPFAALARWYAERERKELDRYLAQAQNVYDLEARMRDLQSGRYWLP